MSAKLLNVMIEPHIELMIETIQITRPVMSNTGHEPRITNVMKDYIGYMVLVLKRSCLGTWPNEDEGANGCARRLVLIFWHWL